MEYEDDIKYEDNLKEDMKNAIRYYVNWRRDIGALNYEIREEIQKILNSLDL